MDASIIVSIVGAAGSFLIALGTVYKFRKGAELGAVQTEDQRITTVAAVTSEELKRLATEVKELRVEVGGLREQVLHFQDQARMSRATIDQLTNDLHDAHRLLTVVRSIFAGYVDRVHALWGKQAEPPTASQIDRAIFEDTLTPDELSLALARAGLA